MKFSTIFICLLLLASFAYADFLSGGNGKVQKLDQGHALYFGLEATATEACTTNAFTLSGYDSDSFASYPVPWAYIGSAEGDSVAVKAIIYGSYDGTNWAIVDTLGTSLTAVVLTKATKDFNNVKMPFYRIIFTGLAANSKATATTFKLWLYLYRAKDL